MIAPGGAIGYIPIANKDIAIKNGFKPVEEEVEPEKPAVGEVPPHDVPQEDENQSPVSLDDPNQVLLVHNETGQAGLIPVDKLGPNGEPPEGFRQPTEFEGKVAAWKNQLNNSYAGPALGTGLQEGLNLFGLGELGEKLGSNLRDKTGEDYQALQEAQRQIREEHPVANIIGNVARIAAEAKIGGALGTAAAPGIETAIGRVGITNPLAVKGLKLAGEGAAFTSPDALVNLLNGDPKGAAEDLALGGVGNVVLHNIFEYGGKGLEVAKKLISPDVVPGTDEAAEKARVALNSVLKELGAPPSAVVDEQMRKAAEGLIRNKIISKDDTLKSALQKVQELEESGPEIGKAVKALDTVPGKEGLVRTALSDAEGQIKSLAGKDFMEREALEASKKPAEVEVKAAKAALDTFDKKEAAVKELKTLENGDENIYETRKKELEAEYQKKVPAYEQRVKLAEDNLANIKAALKEKVPVEVKQARKAVSEILQRIGDASKQGTFAETQAAKKFIREQTNFRPNESTFQNGLRQRAYGIFRDNVAKAEDFAANTLAQQQNVPKETYAAVQSLKNNRELYTWHMLMDKYVGKTLGKEAEHSTLDQLAHTHAMRHGVLGIVGHSLFGQLGAPGGVAVSLGINALKNYSKKHAIGKAVGSFQDAMGLVAKAKTNQDSKILAAVKGLWEKEGQTVKAGLVQGFAKSIIPDQEGKSHEEQLDSLRKTVAEATSNPEAVANHLAIVVAPLRAEGLDKVADEYTEHQLRLLKVIETVIPKDPNMVQAHPFTANISREEISPATKAKYERLLKISAEPEVLISLVKQNTITPLDVAIAAAINPATLQDMRKAVVDEAMKSKPNLSFQQRLSVGILMGTNIDQSTDQLPVLQSSYANAPPVFPVSQGGEKKKGGKMSAKSEDNLDANYQTVSQKAAGI